MCEADSARATLCVEQIDVNKFASFPPHRHGPDSPAVTPPGLQSGPDWLSFLESLSDVK